MGQTICRFILAPNVSLSAEESLARHLCSLLQFPATVFARNLFEKRVRIPKSISARDAAVRIVDIEPTARPTDLIPAGDAVFGRSSYLLRIADDDEMDVTYPSADWLQSIYPKYDLQWLLAPDDARISWNTTSFYVCPGNPTNWGTKIPLMLALLSVAKPNQSRACPVCRNIYLSRGERGQCSKCGFVATPFQNKTEAKNIAVVPLDAFAWGTCPRCRRSREFIHRVEQCFRCGQLLEGSNLKHAISLKENRDEIMQLLNNV